MRLARKQSPDDSATLLVGVVPPPSLPAESGLEELFCAFYRRMHDRALDHAERFLSRDEARDAVSEAMAEIWRDWARLLPEQHPDGYFLGIVHHKVFDQLRAASPLVSLEDAEEQLEKRAFRATDASTRRTTPADVLDLALAEMPPRRREVFLLVREQGFTYKEVAAVLRVSEGTVNTHMRLAADDLRAAFAGTGFRVAGARAALPPAERQAEPQAETPTEPGDRSND